jgi:hypothetical protein
LKAAAEFEDLFGRKEWRLGEIGLKSMLSTWVEGNRKDDW